MMPETGVIPDVPPVAPVPQPAAPVVGMVPPQSPPASGGMKPFLFAGLILAVLAGLGVALYFTPLKGMVFGERDYLVPNIPEVSWFSEEGFNSPYHVADAGVLALLLSYWGEPIDWSDRALATELNLLFYTDRPPAPVLEEFFAGRGYSFERVELATPQDLKRYINSRMRTPLLFLQPLSSEHPGVQVRLLVGVSEKDEMVTVDEFYSGHNREMSFEDFDTLWNTNAPEGGWNHTFYIVRPIDEAAYNAIVNAEAREYAPRTGAMDGATTALTPYIAAFKSRDIAKKAALWTETIESPEFERLHPYYRVLAYSFLARAELLLDQNESAFAHIEQALALNTNLDAVYEGLPRYAYAQLAHPYLTLAQYYAALGDAKKQKQAEDMVREINLRNFNRDTLDSPLSPGYIGLR